MLLLACQKGGQRLPEALSKELDHPDFGRGIL